MKKGKEIMIHKLPVRGLEMYFFYRCMYYGQLQGSFCVLKKYQDVKKQHAHSNPNLINVILDEYYRYCFIGKIIMRLSVKNNRKIKKNQVSICNKA